MTAAALRAMGEYRRDLDWRPLVWAIVVLVAFCLGRELWAQRVSIENIAPTAFNGWTRVTVDRAPPHQVGNVAGSLFVVGRQVGLETRVVDVRVSLPAGGTLSLDLATSTPATFALGGLPAAPLAHFGGWATVGSTPLQIVSLAPDGAGWLVHLRARPAPAVPMLCADLWLVWYPDRPGWARGEVLITASNPAVPAMSATVPANFDLRFGSAIVAVPGGVGPLLAPGTVLADGQARALPVTFVWPQHLATLQDFGSALADAQLGVVGVGIAKLLADGNPTYPAGFSPRGWARPFLEPQPGQQVGEAVRRLHTFEQAVCGPNRISGDTGAQEDAVCVGGEALLPGGTPALLVRYLSALKLAARPCHHREADGSLLDPARHVDPRLLLWDSVPHWHTGVSPDRLGKPRLVTIAEANGWWGSDVEHWLHNTTAAAARLTGSPALQLELSAQARVYLLTCTTVAGWANSGWFAARAVGYEGMLATHLWRDLEDRALAAAVRMRWIDRVQKVFVPQLGTKPGDRWDIRTNDPRLGTGEWWICWQAAVGAYGLDLGCQHVGAPEGRVVALRAAQRVLADAWVFEGGRWKSRAQMPVTGAPPAADETFNWFGMALSVATVLRHDPQNVQARAIWQQLKSAIQTSQTRWMAPGVGP
ncbi:MAG: hypothetical protein WAT39_01875 [Planctomycetota bacterium]